jgi:hypothetical protein
VLLAGAPPRVRVSLVDEHCFEQAALDPIAFRRRTAVEQVTADGQCRLALPPHAYAKIEP